MSLSERIPVLVSPEQREQLERPARGERRSVGAVVRDPVDAYVAPRARSRGEARDELFGREAPVDDWPRMKAEIVGGATGRDPEAVLTELDEAGQRGD